LSQCSAFTIIENAWNVIRIHNSDEFAAVSPPHDNRGLRTVEDAAANRGIENSANNPVPNNAEHGTIGSRRRTAVSPNANGRCKSKKTNLGQCAMM